MTFSFRCGADVMEGVSVPCADDGRGLWNVRAELCRLCAGQIREGMLRTNSQLVLPEGSGRFELFPWAMGREYVYRVRKFSAGKLMGLGPFDESPLLLSDAANVTRSGHY
jgi:hypothetical protein